jgi:hypothetical protein
MDGQLFTVRLKEDTFAAGRGIGAGGGDGGFIVPATRARLGDARERDEGAAAYLAAFV